MRLLSTADFPLVGVGSRGCLTFDAPLSVRPFEPFKANHLDITHANEDRVCRDCGYHECECALELTQPPKPSPHGEAKTPDSWTTITGTITWPFS